MIEIINPNHKFTATCPNCNAELAWDREDLIKEYFGFTSSIFVRYYINCPVCKSKIEIRGWTTK